MDAIGSMLRRPKLYHNIDGTGELGAGIMCLGFALIWGVLMQRPADSIWHQISFLVFIGLVVLIRYGTKAVKTRITYPRTGFVEYQRRWKTGTIAAGLGALTAAGLAAGFRKHWDAPMLASVTGLVFAAACGSAFARTVRWKWIIAGAMGVASCVIALLPMDVLGAWGGDPVHPDRAGLSGAILLSLMVCGTLLLISGGISLWLYLRHTQAPPQEGQ